MRAKSLTKLPHNGVKSSKKNTNEQDNQFHIISQRKQIENTLKQLHKLQSEIYDLNVSQNPHSSSPVKKQIKQLSYLYENMVKPRKRNDLNVKSRDIQFALRIINKQYDNETKLQKQLGEEEQQTNIMQKTLKTTKSKSFRIINMNKKIQEPYKISKDILKQKFNQIAKEDLNINFISHVSRDNQNSYDQNEISVKQLYQFVNYTDSDSFDPIQEAYNMFLNENGYFDSKIYNQYSQILGLPPIKSWNTFLSAVHLVDGQVPSIDHSTITLAQFRHIFSLEL